MYGVDYIFGYGFGVVSVSVSIRASNLFVVVFSGCCGRVDACKICSTFDGFSLILSRGKKKF